MITMGESDKPPEKSISETGKPVSEAPKSNMILLILGCIVVGLLIGYVAYAIFAPQQPQPPAPTPNFNITPIPAPVANLTPQIQVVVINDSRCTYCNSTDLLLSTLVTDSAQLGVNITKVTVFDASSSEGAALISKYSLDVVPTMIITGDTNASASLTSGWANLGSIEPDGAMVYRNVYPPYYNLSSNRVDGVVNVTELRASSCVDCFNISAMVDMLSGAQIGMRVGSITSYEYNSSEGKALLAKYNITKVPSMLLSPDAGAYPSLAKAWSNVGTIEPDGAYVYREVYAPYINLTSGSVIGHVSIIELTDQSCTDCYNVSVHYDGLRQQGGMVFTNRTTYAMNSTTGQQLIKKYNITAVPTIVLSPDALSYAGFGNYWGQIGSVESDGWLVLRSVGDFGTYMNLTTGNVTNSTAPSNPSITTSG